MLPLASQETELQRMMVLLTEDGGENGLNFEQFLSLVIGLALLLVIGIIGLIRG